MEKLICLLSFVVWLYLLPTASSVSAATVIELKPNNPDVFVGKSLLMMCSVRSSDTFTSEDLVFKFKKYNLSTDEWEKTSNRVPLKYVSRLTKRVAQLNWTAATEDMDRMAISCHIRSSNDLTDGQIIRVSYPISKPEIFDYRVLNWESLIFKWKVDRLDRVFNTIFTAWYKLPGQKFSSCQLQEANGTTSSCRVGIILENIPSGLVEIKVNGSNKLHQTTESNVSIVDVHEIIEPAQVKYLAVTRMGANSPIVKFRTPKPSNWLFYNIEVYCGSQLHTNSAPIINDTFSSYKMMHSYNLSHLPSYTSCKVSIRCKPNYYEKQRDRGFWSEWSTEEFTSQEGVPVTAPKTCRSCFESKEINQTMRQVVIYYKQLEAAEARGTVVEYRSVKLPTGQCRLNLTSNSTNCVDETLTEVANVSHIHWLLSMDREYKLGLDAATVAGYNSSRLFEKESIHIPVQAEIPRQPSNFTAIIVDSKVVNVSWQDHPDAVRYVVVWCTGSRNIMKCMGELQWAEVSAESHVYQISVLLDPSDYLFGIAIETDMQSSGIHWSSCTYNTHYAARPPDTVADTVTQTSITLAIERPFCEHNSGYIYGYAICWTVYSHIESPDSMKNSISVDRASLKDDSFYTIDNLLPGTDYLISVQSLTLAGPSYLRTRGLKARTAAASLGAGAIAGVVIGGIFLLTVTSIGLLSCFRKFRYLFYKCHKYWCGLDVKLPLSAFDPAYYDRGRTCESDYCRSADHNLPIHHLWLNNNNNTNNTVAHGNSNPMHQGIATATVERLIDEDSVRPTTSTAGPLLQETDVVNVRSDIQSPHAVVASRPLLTDGYSVCLRHEKQIFTQIPTSAPNEMEFDDILDCETPSCMALEIPESDAVLPCSGRTSTDSETTSSDAHASGCLYSRVARPRETVDSFGDAKSSSSGGDVDEDPADNSAGVSNYLQCSKFSSETTSCDEATDDSRSTSSSCEAAVDDYNACRHGCYRKVYDKMMTDLVGLAISMDEDDPCAPMLLYNDEATVPTITCNVGDLKSENSSLDLELFHKCFGPNKNRKACPTTSVCLPVNGWSTPSPESKPESVHPSCPSIFQPVNSFSVTSLPDNKLEPVHLSLPSSCQLADVASLRTDNAPARVLPSIESESSSSGGRWLSLLNNELQATVV